MRVSCGAPKSTASSGLIPTIEALGITPIVTSQTIRAVYEGNDQKLGTQIVEVFEKEYNHDITVDYSAQEQRKALRKAEKAAKNAALHGHRR